MGGATAVEAVDGDTDFWADGDCLRSALREAPPRIPPHFGYDDLGSQLFEEITELPNYYLTRVEDRLMRRHASAIADAVGTPWVAELGSGSGKKTRVLLAACAARRDTAYLPIDVSHEMLVSSGDALATECPEVVVRGLWGRYEAGLEWIRRERTSAVTAMLLGSTLGNATAAERRALIAEIVRTLAPGDRFLVSADLIKPADILERCYNDPPGHSAFARFRLNHLTHLNRRFDGDFALDQFWAEAHFNERIQAVEGHLHATSEHVARLRALGLSMAFRAGDVINVGISAKFDPVRLADEMREFGLVPGSCWTDERWRYGIFLFHRR
ncbi:L-histidine Nalpha-methyltransferase [Saccharopolyspora antimicrobica]|uniref:L-histidine N-alpha-methyltransferase n=1 Tax=Saccharopolyspora antimicrobica TaxID=455193 RepID=A0A1I5KT63_9PSEU|nr:L-histidine N(alpha)-methyltransferase [Saccharopolyspora antimicrobica]RKT89144.1 L-histidine N-alpha-methyltransferase [Saccharopolyspora antimicrobica]SFO87816.1 L-histidine Nalpha-methyltransferase [Saccharopolyspora antimicrobica]